MKYNDPKTHEGMVYCIDGTITSHSNCLAFCCNRIHRGFLTKKQLKAHQCIEKECQFLKPTDNPYWKSRNKKEEEKTNIKNARKKHKDKEKYLLGIAPEEIGAVFCKHLYKNIYLMVLNNEFEKPPHQYFLDAKAWIYFVYVPKEMCNNIDVTFPMYLPTEVRRKYIETKNDHKRHM